MNERYLYIKNGDVVSQIKELGWPLKEVPDGGPNAFLADFLRHVIGDQVMLIGCSNNNERYKEANISARNHQCGKSDRSKAVSIFYHIKTIINAFVQMVRYKPTKIICGRTGYMLWQAYILSRLWSIPMVHSRHNRVMSPSSGMIRKIIENVDAAIIRRCEGVVCHGPYLKRELQDIGVEPSRLFEFDSGFKDIVEMAAKVKLPKQLNEDENRLVIAYVGRIEENKGVFDLLEASERLILDNPNLLLVYAGDGSAMKRLSEIVVEKKLQENVVMLGRLNREELVGFLSVAAVLVAPTKLSFPEGRCMVVMEGLVLGVPVIAPNFGPFPYLIKDNVNGFLFKPDDVGDLEFCLRKVVIDEKVRESLKLTARATGRELVDPENRFGRTVMRAFGG